MLSIGKPNYGIAMKAGILEARGRYVICDEIDLLDTEFYARALALLERSDTEFVVGTKAMVGSNDQRPMFRRVATRVYNGMLRVVCHYGGTDTHGLKAFPARRRWSRPRAAACSTATCSRASTQRRAISTSTLASTCSSRGYRYPPRSGRPRATCRSDPRVAAPGIDALKPTVAFDPTNSMRSASARRLGVDRSRRRSAAARAQRPDRHALSISPISAGSRSHLAFAEQKLVGPAEGRNSLRLQRDRAGFLLRCRPG